MLANLGAGFMIELLRYIWKGINTLGEHFKSGCDRKYLLIQVIEKVTPNSEHLRLQREKYWIEKLDTKVPYGLNRLVSA